MPVIIHAHMNRIHPKLQMLQSGHKNMRNILGMTSPY